MDASQRRQATSFTAWLPRVLLGKPDIEDEAQLLWPGRTVRCSLRQRVADSLGKQALGRPVVED